MIREQEVAGQQRQEMAKTFVVLVEIDIWWVMRTSNVGDGDQ